MSTYLNKLIEGVKHELEHERARVEHVVFRQKAIEMRETGALKRLEQRLEVLEQLKVKEAGTNRRRAASSARVSRRRGTAVPRQLDDAPRPPRVYPAAEELRSLGSFDDRHSRPPRVLAHF